jgi:tetratricopeptide (TPR) repeat protein
MKTINGGIMLPMLVFVLSSNSLAATEGQLCHDEKLAHFEDLLGKCKGEALKDKHIETMKSCMKESGLDALADYVYLAVSKKMNINLSDVAAELTARDKDGTNALCYAIREGEVEIIRFLVEKKLFDPNTRSSDGSTSLMIAAADGSQDLVRMLIAQHADMNMQDKKGMTALMFAAQGGYQPIVADFLVNFANVRLKDEKGKTALYYACLNGQEDVVGMLEGSAGNDADFTGLSVYYLRKGNQSLAKKYIDIALAINPRNELALFTQGTFYANSGDYLQAIESFEKAVKLDPKNSTFWEYLSESYQMAGSYAKGLEAINKALELKRDDPRIVMKIAELHLLKGDAAVARTTYEKAYQGQTRSLDRVQNPAVFTEASWNALFTGRFKEAEKYARNALEMDDKYLEAYSKLGHAFLLQGKKGEALDAFRKYLKNNSGTPAENLGHEFWLLRRRFPEKSEVFSWAAKELGHEK